MDEEYQAVRKRFQPQSSKKIKTNLSMSNYLDQLREQVRLKQLGLKEQKQQQPPGLPGLSSVYDYININIKGSKK